MFKENGINPNQDVSNISGDNSVKIDKDVYGKINQDILLKMDLGDKFLFTKSMNDNIGDHESLVNRIVSIKGFNHDSNRIFINEVGDCPIRVIVSIDELVEKVSYEDFYKQVSSGSSFRLNDKVYTVLEKANNLQTITALCNGECLTVSISDYKLLTDIKTYSQEDINLADSVIKNNLSIIPQKGDKVSFKENTQDSFNQIEGTILGYSANSNPLNPTYIVKVGDFHLDEVYFDDLITINGEKIESLKSKNNLEVDPNNFDIGDKFRISNDYIKELNKIIDKMEKSIKEGVGDFEDTYKTRINYYQTLLTDLNESDNIGELKEINGLDGYVMEINGNKYNFGDTLYFEKLNSEEDFYHNDVLENFIERISTEGQWETLFYKGHRIQVKLTWESDRYYYEDDEGTICDFKNLKEFKEYFRENYGKLDERVFNNLTEIEEGHLFTKDMIYNLHDTIKGIEVRAYGNVLKDGDEEIGAFFYKVKKDDSMVTFIKIDFNFYKCVYKYISEM